MTFNEALRRARIAREGGEIDAYRVENLPGLWRVIHATSIDGDEFIYFDERYQC